MNVKSNVTSSMPRSIAKVTYVTSSISRAGGGVSNAARELALAILNGGRCSVSVVGLRDPHAHADLRLWGDISVQTHAVRGPSSFGYSPHLLDALLRSNPDILHIHGLWMYPSVAATRWSGPHKPYVVSPHGMLDPWALNNSRWKKRISAALYERRHLRGASCLHALNIAEAEAIRAYGLKNPICIIPNGIELPEVPKQRTGQPTHTLLYLGRLHPKKGLPNLLEAWSLVHKEADESRWRLAIAGWDQNGHQRDLEALSARLKIESTVSFVGPKFGESKTACFGEASAFILPSLSEGLPMVVLEAWSWGLPVLMTPRCNLPEGEAAGAALMMDVDADSIAATLRRLFSMCDLNCETMGVNGRRLVEERFQWPQIAKQMADVYDWALGLGPKPLCVVD